MHVLLASNRFAGDESGGTESLAAGLADGLIQRGHQVSWLAACAPGGFPPGVRPVRIPERSRHRGQLRYPWGWRKADTATADGIGTALSDLPTVDVVHVLHFSRFGLTYLDRAPLAETPAVATLTDYTAVCADFQLRHRPTGLLCSPCEPARRCAACIGLPHSSGAVDIASWRRRNLDWLARRCHAVWVQTPHQRSLLAAAGIPQSSFASDRARYPIPPEWASLPAAVGEGVLFVGRASPEKGLDVLLDAVTNLRSVDLTVVTRRDDTAYEARLRQAAAEADGRVRWLPPAPLESLGKLIAEASVLAVPSQWLENHPLVTSYALAVGTTVLCSDVPSMRHLAADGDVRLVAPYDEPAAWARALEKLVTVPRTPTRNRVDEFNAGFDAFIDATTAVYLEAAAAAAGRKATR